MQYLNNVRDCIKQVNELGESILCHTTLATEVVMECRYEPAKRLATLWTVA